MKNPYPDVPLRKNEAQNIQLRLMEMASFNDFNGEGVVNFLKNNRDLWRGAYMTRAANTYAIREHGQMEGVDLIMLRDLCCGQWNVDTLYILPVEGKEEQLEALAQGWEADEVSWIGGDEAQQLLGIGRLEKPEKMILRCWWD